ncbi:hypothetical protein [Prochlorococcus sp. MIT 1300]|uniref:hypothetical protein n=1 Tax=Prochlorococcus sp. MIT 1300 TaxID=3096218 RepID=UPI002A74A079|nr:hypothetical protein [Prochlorococcus sp. MIT 1300]
MAIIEDHAYLKICASLASCLSISLAAARKKVELASAKAGVRDLASRKKIAEDLLNHAKTLSLEQSNSPSKSLDRLLEALAEDENFMIED